MWSLKRPRSWLGLVWPPPLASRLHPCSIGLCSIFYAVCTFAEVSGIFQLFTSHHHLLILAPTDWPFNVEDLFMCLHPETTRVHAMPCTKGMKICNMLDPVLSTLSCHE
jgi:hypothetical protein